MCRRIQAFARQHSKASMQKRICIFTVLLLRQRLFTMATLWKSRANSHTGHSALKSKYVCVLAHVTFLIPKSSFFQQSEDIFCLFSQFQRTGFKIEVSSFQGQVRVVVTLAFGDGFCVGLCYARVFTQIEEGKDAFALIF